ncbi:lipoprotein [Caballeronia udeis]|uniref:Lipoprotein n=1 Tax=Caballeronia udeis TaxID=1232866 RepID=A0A158F1K2_9BURK|nr:DUF2242 domain-containing protein [Caballeronia udeis]SAL13718.1 lipoprotein [Caballeronia udeis]
MQNPLARPLFRLSLALPLLALAACGGKAAPTPSYQAEMFTTGASPFARNYEATSQETCEASRRALLSQGYMTTMPQPDTVDATKNFQPAADTHVVVSFHVVCTPGENASNTSIAYVNAVQDGYTLKKSDTSASVGLSVLGSLSLPIRSNSDSMVKISSETVPAGKFYDRFFSLVEHYLKTVPRSSPIPGENVSSQAIAPSLILNSPDLTPTPIVVQTPAASSAARAAVAASAASPAPVASPAAVASAVSAASATAVTAATSSASAPVAASAATP